MMTVNPRGSIIRLALANVLIDIALELPAESVPAAGRHYVLQGYGFGGDHGRGCDRLSRAVAVVSRGGVGPVVQVQVVPAV